MKTTKERYVVFLDISLKKSKYIDSSVNISQIPYSELEKLFRNQIRHEKSLFDNSTSYEITKDLFNSNKSFFSEEIPITFNFDLYEYFVSLYSISDDSDEHCYTTLPLPIK